MHTSNGPEVNGKKTPKVKTIQLKRRWSTKDLGRREGAKGEEKGARSKRMRVDMG